LQKGLDTYLFESYIAGDYIFTYLHLETRREISGVARTT